MSRRIRTTVLMLASTAIGCGTNPAAPTTATAVPPLAAQPVALATLAIQEFSVTGWADPNDRRFHYWPKLTLAETSGVSDAAITQIVFELLDVGPTGRVPPVPGRSRVPSGGTIQFDEDGYGSPWLEIDSSANAARVSVVVSYVDGAGRGASVSAIAQVSR